MKQSSKWITLGVIGLVGAAFPACGRVDSDKKDGDGTSTEGTSGDGDQTGTGSGDLLCPGATQCGEVCVNTDLDPDHCGECNSMCEGGEVCSMGSCASSCKGGTSQCGDLCVDLNVDANHCGKCEKSCGSGEVCDEGTCAVSCGAGRELCGGSCVDIQTDRDHCGKCGTSCDAGEVCSGGSCSLSCAEGQINCEGECINPLSDERHCGASGSCSAAPDGGGGAGGEASIPEDWRGEACEEGYRCEQGACARSCVAGLNACDGACVDLKSDPMHCGECGVHCAANETCSAEGCVVRPHVCAEHGYCDQEEPLTVEGGVSCYCDAACGFNGDCCSPDGKDNGPEFLFDTQVGWGVQRACDHYEVIFE